MNCLFGPGDIGKSTILDAIELALGATQRSTTLTEMDFHKLDTSVSLSIEVVIGDLDDRLKDVEQYGEYHSGWGPTGQLIDEPDLAGGFEAVLVRELEVKDDLEPRWRLKSNRVSGREKDLRWVDRDRIAPVRLGAYTGNDMGFGLRSVLTRLAGKDFAGTPALIAASRAARRGFKDAIGDCLFDLVALVQQAAQTLNVPAEGVCALLDFHAAAISQRGVSLHDGNEVPLARLGTGSSRLLVSAMQKRLAGPAICLVDEIEHGLEPYRIKMLLEMLSPHQGHCLQVFGTTHSPVVLRELAGERLHLVSRKETGGSHNVANLSTIDHMKTIRACAEAFLAPAAIVCEGKTEIGLLRGLHEGMGDVVASRGVYFADGGGSSAFERAIVFKGLGYKTALFLDNDRLADEEKVKACEEKGIKIFRWPQGNALENVLFDAAPDDAVGLLLTLAIEAKGEGSISDGLKVDHSRELTDIRSDPAQFRNELGNSAKKHGWFKDIVWGEKIGRRIVGPKLGTFAEPMPRTFKAITTWAMGEDDG